MNKFARYTRRLILWFERPLRREEKQIIWEWACAWQYDRLMHKFGTMQVQQQKLPPITIRQRVAMQKLRASLPPATIPLSVQHVELVDETWLNSTPVSVIEEEQEQDDEHSTNKVPIISKLKWERN
jgi:hypothetical protein